MKPNVQNITELPVSLISFIIRKISSAMNNFQVLHTQVCFFHDVIFKVNIAERVKWFKEGEKTYFLGEQPSDFEVALAY